MSTGRRIAVWKALLGHNDLAINQRRSGLAAKVIGKTWLH